MSTATDNPTNFPLAPPKTMFWRFVWKEFRMIRALWAAVAVMGLLVDCAERMFLVAATNFPLTSFYTALACAVLYAVGAAATTFSVEHEEETYDLLARLPITWWPPFAGKLLVTFVSAVLLAVLLSIPTLLGAGSHYLSERDVVGGLGMLGFGIVEAIAWGTLFSLLIKRPLLAAITTLIVGTVAVNIAVTSMSRYTAASINPDSYLQAMPLRFAIVVAVFACSTFVARGWLTTGTRPANPARFDIYNRLATFLAGIVGRTYQVEAGATGGSRRRMLARLLWQTWRESWKLLFAPLGVAALVFAGMAAIVGLAQVEPNEVVAFLIPTALLFAPALYGAMTFYPDQRRGNYRFLAEHAARPRFAWLARHIVWLGALTVVWILLVGSLAALAGHFTAFESREIFASYMEWGMPPAPPHLIYDVAAGTEIAIRVLTGATFGALIAYGVGQLLSMAIRSEILAAFLALLLSFAVSAWVYVCCLWQLSAMLFLLPIFAGLMLATWLRAPDWIAGRNSFRAWLKPALAVLVPVLLIGALLPGTRLGQLRYRRPISFDQLAVQEGRQRSFDERLADFRAADDAEATKTADMYERVATKLAGGIDRDLFKRWRKPEYIDPSTVTRTNTGEIDEAKLLAGDLKAFHEAKERQIELTQQLYASVIKEVMRISKRPTCRFHFDPSSIVPGPAQPSFNPKVGIAANRAYQTMTVLIASVVSPMMLTEDQGERNFLAAPRFLTALRMGKHLRSGQPSIVVTQQLKDEQRTLQEIADWSLSSKRTKEELRELLDTLTPELQAPESPAQSVLADRDLILDVVSGKELPYILTKTPVEPLAHLAYMANQLSWERQRAEKALDQITRVNFHDVDRLADTLGHNNPQEIGVGVVRHWLRPDYDALPELWKVQEPEADTSYLVSLEYSARAPISTLNRAFCDNVTFRHATLLRIALALYHLEHKEYPQQLSQLVPDYLEQLPLDPYARQPFHYLPAGLDHPLHGAQFFGEYMNYVMIEPNRPLFWSVGVGNVRMVLLTRQVESKKAVAPDEEPKPGKLELQYDFVNEDQTWWNSYTFAFPLPK